QERPFSSLEQFRDTELAPGARVHLKAGTACADSDTPFWGYGTEEAPIVVDLYDGTVPPTFGDRTAVQVFGALEAQGWTLSFSEAGPAVALGDDGQVKVGDLATVSVSGFPAGSTVDVAFDGGAKPAGAITTDADGTGSVRLRMAGIKPGAYVLTAETDEVSAKQEVVVKAGRSG